MRGKKGFIRIIEVSVAILIIASVMAFIYMGRQQKFDEGTEFEVLLDLIRKEIANNPDLRNNVLNCDNNSDGCPNLNNSNCMNLNGSLSAIASPARTGGFEIKFRICDLDDACGALTSGTCAVPASVRVYSGDYPVGATLDAGFNPRKIRVFLWAD